jgi:hypothetical protein
VRVLEQTVVPALLALQVLTFLVKVVGVAVMVALEMVVRAVLAAVVEAAVEAEAGL